MCVFYCFHAELVVAYFDLVHNPLFLFWRYAWHKLCVLSFYFHWFLGVQWLAAFKLNSSKLFMIFGPTSSLLFPNSTSISMWLQSAIVRSCPSHSSKSLFYKAETLPVSCTNALSFPVKVMMITSSFNSIFSLCPLLWTIPHVNFQYFVILVQNLFLFIRISSRQR